MIRYEVTLTVQPSIAAALEEWMRHDHIPAILATGCFVRIRFDRNADGFRTVYHAERYEDYQRYLDQFAARFRADFNTHFPEGAAASREVWESAEEWPPR